MHYLITLGVKVLLEMGLRLCLMDLHRHQ